MTCFAGYLRALLEASVTGHCRPGFARDFAAAGLTTWPFGTQNPEAVTRIEHGQHLAGLLWVIARILNPPPDGWSLTGLMEIPL